MYGIFHGGFRGLKAAEAREAWRSFFGAMAEKLPDNPRVVIVPWASSPKQWQQTGSTFERRALEFGFTYSSITIAQSAENLADILYDADLVYLPGGIFIKRLIDSLNQSLTKVNLPKDVTFAGYSAGAYAMADIFYDAKAKKTEKGCSLFKCAVCCHYSHQRLQASELLLGKSDAMFLLKDGEQALITNR